MSTSGVKIRSYIATRTAYRIKIQFIGIFEFNYYMIWQTKSIKYMLRREDLLISLCNAVNDDRHTDTPSYC